MGIEFSLPKSAGEYWIEEVRDIEGLVAQTLLKMTKINIPAGGSLKIHPLNGAIPLDMYGFSEGGVVNGLPLEVNETLKLAKLKGLSLKGVRSN